MEPIARYTDRISTAVDRVGSSTATATAAGTRADGDADRAENSLRVEDKGMTAPDRLTKPRYIVLSN